MERLKKNSTLEHSNVLSESIFFNEREMVQTPIPGLNIAYSGEVDGGLSSGIHVWAGPSKHFKSMFCLISVASYLHRYPDSVCLFYDNERGSPPDYFKAAGISPERVLHSPFVSLEELRTDITTQLKDIKRGDKVIFMIDSLGLAASNKEIQDAEDGKEKADFTRAKINKSLFRIITPHLWIKDIPMVAVQHTYETMEMFSKTVVSGGTGTMLAADNVYVLGRRQEKEGTELTGYSFIINIEKSRFVKEKSKIPVTVKRDNSGIMRWGGLFDLALEGGFLHRNSAVSYSLVDQDGVVHDDKLRRKEIENDSKFWRLMLERKDFKEYIKSRFKLSSKDLLSKEEELTDVEDKPMFEHQDKGNTVIGDPELESNN